MSVAAANDAESSVVQQNGAGTCSGNLRGAPLTTAALVAAASGPNKQQPGAGICPGRRCGAPTATTAACSPSVCTASGPRAA